MFRRKSKADGRNILDQLTISDGSSQMQKVNLHISGIGIFAIVVAWLAAIIGLAIMNNNGVPDSISIPYFIIVMLGGLYLMLAMKVASQWEKAVVLRFGNFHKLAGPGFFWIIPIADSTVNWIDHRVNVTPFSAEKTLTKDAA